MSDDSTNIVNAPEYQRIIQELSYTFDGIEDVEKSLNLSLTLVTLLTAQVIATVIRRTDPKALGTSVESISRAVEMAVAKGYYLGSADTIAENFPTPVHVKVRIDREFISYDGNLIPTEEDKRVLN